MIFDEKIGVHIPSEKEIKRIVQGGKPKEQAELYLRHQTTQYLLHKPLLKAEEAKALQEVISAGEGDSYRHYLALYRKNLVFRRSLSIVQGEWYKARWCIATLRGYLIAANQIDGAEDIINSILATMSPEKREEVLNYATRSTKFHSSSIKIDEEKFLEIDTSKSWEGLFFGENKSSLEDLIKEWRDWAQEAITSFSSCLAGFRDFTERVKFPFSEIYLKFLEGLEQSIGRRWMSSFKYDLAAARAAMEERADYSPYLEPKREKILKEYDFLSFNLEPNEQQRRNNQTLFLAAWDALQGRRMVAK